MCLISLSPTTRGNVTIELLAIFVASIALIVVLFETMVMKVRVNQGTPFVSEWKVISYWFVCVCGDLCWPLISMHRHFNAVVVGVILLVGQQLWLYVTASVDWALQVDSIQAFDQLCSCNVISREVYILYIYIFTFDLKCTDDIHRHVTRIQSGNALYTIIYIYILYNYC